MYNLEEYLRVRNTNTIYNYAGNAVVEAYLRGDETIFTRAHPEVHCAIYSSDIFQFGMSLPFEKIPLYMNTTDNDMQEVIKYRLKQGS